MEQVKLLSMTVVLTVLIWAAADSLVNEAVTVNVSFTPVSGGGPDLLIESRPTADSYELEVSGPRKVVEDLQEQSPLEIRLALPDRSTGSTEILLDRAVVKRALVGQWSEFRKLAVVSIQPDTLPIVVDHWVTREIDIVMRRLRLAYDVEPQLSRSTTTVRVRESRLRAWPEGQPLQIDIAVDVERLLREQPPGQPVAIPVTLDARSFGPGAVLSPATVEVTATVKAQRRTAEIPTVPILFAVSSANLEKPHRAVARDGSPLSLVTQTITVTGPTDAVTRLVRGTTRAFGIIQLKEEDLERLGVLKLVTPDYQLPRGVELAAEPTPIEFRLIEASATESGG